jgi:lycopene beta-cyclase
MKRYDFAILGGGASGLSLALALLRSPLAGSQILLLEKEAKDRNDRTWSFWTNEHNPLDDIRYASWEKLNFTSDGFERHFSLSPYRYQMVRGIDFYKYAYRELSRYPNVDVVRAGVDEVASDAGEAVIEASGESYRAGWAFDSRFAPERLPAESGRYRFLMQHFKGWEVETEKPSFDPQTATLFDLRTPQRGGLCFYYVLPFSPQRALVEYTVFSASLLPDEVYRQALREYVQDCLKLPSYRIVHEEGGVIPMTDYAFPRRLGPRLMAIGTLGGRVKPSTGYAFLRIQRDSEAIVHSLVEKGHPFDLPAEPWRRRFYDALLLEILVAEGERAKSIFDDLFKKNTIQRIFRFLDERSTLWEDIRLIGSLPSGPFLRALWAYMRRR